MLCALRAQHCCHLPCTVASYLCPEVLAGKQELEQHILTVADIRIAQQSCLQLPTLHQKGPAAVLQCCIVVHGAFACCCLTTWGLNKHTQSKFVISAMIQVRCSRTCSLAGRYASRSRSTVDRLEHKLQPSHQQSNHQKLMSIIPTYLSAHHTGVVTYCEGVLASVFHGCFVPPRLSYIIKQSRWTAFT